MFGLFDGLGMFNDKTYRGSNFERAILGRVDQISQDRPDNGVLFTSALLHEHPQLLLDDPNSRDLCLQIAARTAWATGVLIGSAFVAARDYGQGLDELRCRDSVAALAVSSCLVQFLDASDVPLSQTSGGYYRYFSAYLILRQAFGLFGFLEPWRNFIKTIEIPEGLAGLDLSAYFDGDIQMLSKLAPRVEQESREHALLQINGLRSTIGMIPPQAAALSLNIMLDLPPGSFSTAWTMSPSGPAPHVNFINHPSAVAGGQLGLAATQVRGTIIDAGVPLRM